MTKVDFPHQRQVVTKYLGENFTALMCGLETSELRSWLNGEFNATRAQTDTIRSAYRLWKLLQYYDADTTKLWLTSENPHLNGVWPIMIIAHYPNDVFIVAKRWISEGSKTIESIR